MIAHPVGPRSAIVHLDLDEVPECDAEVDARIEYLGLVVHRDGLVVDFVFAGLERNTGSTPRDVLRAHRPWLDVSSSIVASYPSDVTGLAPTITAAICTRERPERLRRLLESIAAMRSVNPSLGLDVLVVDNAPVSDETERVVETFEGVRYVREPRAGLDFARNRAIAETDSELLAYLDDDVVVDLGWLAGLHLLRQTHPDAGGFSGLVMPFALETDAQIAFERNGGFGRGPQPRRMASRIPGSPLFPLGAGAVGAGCNMAFERSLLESIGGFDTALDTGAPLPGGGDLDIFYRVLEAGRPMGYDPAYAVYHEHRRTSAELRHQYYTWGLGFMAYLEKVSDATPGQRREARHMRRWWLRQTVRELRSSLVGASAPRTAGDVVAELRGGAVGALGEYQRSQRRSAAIENAVEEQIRDA